jgi:hypothetical protein
LKDRLASFAEETREKATRLGILMKIALLVTLLAISPSAEGQTTAAPASKEAASIRELIQADRAKAKTDEENASKDRPWDRKEAPLK